MDPETKDTELAKVIADMGDDFQAFKRKYDDALAAEVENREEVERKLNRLRNGGSVPSAGDDVPAPEMWLDVKSRQPIPVLTHRHRLADYPLGEKPDLKELPSVGRMLRGLVLGGRADDHEKLADERKALAIVPDSSGGYTVPWALSSTWIDLLRARMVLSQAGARTVPMSTRDVQIARVVTDPAVSWHGENSDITPTEPTFGAQTLSAKTVVAVVKFSLELSQDSVNIEQILQSTLTNALANAIDSAGLVGVDEDAAAAPTGVFNMTGRNTVTGVGAPSNWDFLIDGMGELLVDNVPMSDVGAFIAHPEVWKTMAKLKTGLTSDETSLVPPREVAELPKLWTTAAPLDGSTAKGVIANWRDLLFGVRQEIQVRVLSERYMADNLQLAMVAWARVAFVQAREESFCTLEGITTS